MSIILFLDDLIKYMSASQFEYIDYNKGAAVKCG